MNISDEMVERAARVLNTRLASRDGLYGVSRDMLEAALGDTEQVGWRYRFEPDLRWHLEEYENTIPKKSEFPRIEVEPLYAFKEPRK